MTATVHGDMPSKGVIRFAMRIAKVGNIFGVLQSSKVSPLPIGYQTMTLGSQCGLSSAGDFGHPSIQD